MKELLGIENPSTENPPAISYEKFKKVIEFANNVLPEKGKINIDKYL